MNEPPVSPGLPQERTVLVVDDDPSSRTYLVEVLDECGFRAVQATDCGEALRKLMEEPPDLIFTDLRMPGMDGMEFLTLARSLVPEVPLVLITACAEKEAAAEAMRRGAAAFLQKPARLTDLRAVLTRLSPERRPEQADPRSCQTGEAGWAGGGGFRQSPHDARMRGGLDPALLRKATQLSFLAGFGLSLRAPTVSDLERTTPSTEGWTQAPGISSLVHRSLDVALRALPGDRAVLALTEGGGVQEIVSRGRENHPIPLAWVATHLGDGGLGHPWHGVLQGMPLVAAPLTIQGAKVGFICVGRDHGASAFTWADRDLLEAFSAETTVTLENACLGRQLEQAFQETVTSLIVTLEARDKYTEGHSLRVAEYATGIAAAQRLPPTVCEQIRTASLLHDLGKVGVRDSILEKPGRLSPEEWAAMRQHPVLGWKILEPLGFLSGEARGVRHHHEHFDGTGYPDGLARDAIPLLARVIAVADAFDAMTTPRPYRPSRSTEASLAELNRTAGTQFDPQVVETFECWLNSEFGRKRTV